jgi:phage shock protein B
MLELAVILSLTIVAPIWIIAHYWASWRRHRGLSTQDETMLRDLHDSAEKINDRLGTIERILDHEIPDWRKAENEDL